MADKEERPLLPMELGLRVDVLDNEGIWNTGKIVDVSREEEDMVEIKYDGWGDEYNEWVPLSAQRLAPLHMFTMVKKCWAKLTKWPWWPAFVVLRAPTRKSAAEALNAESKVYVEFFDSYNEEKRSRCWMQKKNIVSFKEGFDERASKNIGKSFPAYVEGTQRAIAGGSPVLFSGNGTLPIEFSSRYTKSLAAHKLELVGGDDEKWFEAYRIFSQRYRVLYGYDFAKDSANTLLAAGHAKANGSGASAEEDEDDEVEIIESTIGSSASAATAKRGRGRPPTGKHAKKQPKKGVQYADDGSDDDVQAEEKDDDDEYQDAGDDAEEEEDDEEDEVAESPRGRRSSRLNKRKPHEEETTTRRNTRPRRAKELVYDEEDDEGEDFTHYEYNDDIEAEDDEEDRSSRGGGRSSSRSVSPSPEMRQSRPRFNVKAHKRTALTQLMASTQPQPVLKKQQQSTRLQRPLGSEPLMREMEAFVKNGGEPSTSVPSPVLSNAKSRRKSAAPQSLSVSPQSAAVPMVENPELSTGSSQGGYSLRHWLGFGAADEGLPVNGGTRRSWSIQNWLLNGFRRKQASESTTNEE